MKIFLSLLFVQVFLLADISKIIGESNTLKPDVTDKKELDMEMDTYNASCNCSSSISSTYNQIKMQIEQYEEKTIESLKELRKQVAENKNELANRTDSIKDNSYYESLNNAIKYINSDISTPKDISKIKLSGYNNLLLLSNNGFLYKNNNLFNVYSAINELEQLENKLKILRDKE